VFSGTTHSSEETFSASVGASNMASVAGGTVTGAGSAPVAGAVIDLYAWPSDAVLMSMKIGAQVPTTLLATAITSKAGQYVLRVPMATLKAAAVESGYANLEITSTGGAVWFLSYQTSSPHAGPSAPVTVNVTARGHLCGKNKDGEYYAGSPFVKLRQLKAAPAIVGQGYIGPVKTAGDSMDFEYDQTGTHSQTSTLSVGISAVGVSAGYTRGGTSTSTATGSEGFPGQTKNSLFLRVPSEAPKISERFGAGATSATVRSLNERNRRGALHEGSGPISLAGDKGSCPPSSSNRISCYMDWVIVGGWIR
jgi:hypothetical protein